MSEDILDKLFVDEVELNKEVVFELLINFIKLTKEGEIVPLKSYEKLNNNKKILLILLAKKVLFLKEMGAEFVSPTEIMKITGMPKGTVNPTLRGLSLEGYIRNEQGNYAIPNFTIMRIKEFLGVGKNDQSKH